MTTDAFGFVTQESDLQLWTTLNQIWLSERKPGYVIKGSNHYVVAIINDVPKFRLMNNEALYNDISMGG